MLSEPIAVTLLVIKALEAIKVPYLIGGSFATAVYGVARLTADADLVADVGFEHVDQLAGRLSSDFYLARGRSAPQQFQSNSFQDHVQGRCLPA
jgi:hypothetical protein